MGTTSAPRRPSYVGAGGRFDGGKWNCGWRPSSEPWWRRSTTTCRWRKQGRRCRGATEQQDHPCAPWRSWRSCRPCVSILRCVHVCPCLGIQSLRAVYKGKRPKGGMSPAQAPSARSAIHQHAHLDSSWHPDGEHRNFHAALNVVGLLPFSEMLVWYIQAYERKNGTFINQETSEPCTSDSTAYTRQRETPREPLH